MAYQDVWAQWLADWRAGGEGQPGALEYLYLVRDGILQRAALTDNDVLLDIGGGDGLVGFGAFEQVPTCHVVFGDISPTMFDRVRKLAEELGVLERSRFFPASADNLATLTNGFVDVVAGRSVLIYVADKQTAFNEFYRVLKPGGRLSLFEPVNRFAHPEPVHLFRGYDVTPVVEIATKLKAFYDDQQPLDTDPMLTFADRDLLVFAEQAGFEELHLELHMNITAPPPTETWATFLHIPENPKIPSLAAAMQELLSPAEGEQFMAHLQPLVENRQGIKRLALAYLWGMKGQAAEG